MKWTVGVLNYMYVSKSCRTENFGIPSLRWASKLCATPVDKAESLNEFFQSVFTHEDLHSLP